MAYTKTTWQNNVTDIDANNLNKMEQGIYDNSLVVDAVTNTLNPTDTETYKTAELTEGQITDVIGVSDILIKGQTSQNGEPTPSSPVDVNVVSGSNTINTSNKNLLDITKITPKIRNGITININNSTGETELKGTTTEGYTAFEIGIDIDSGPHAISCDNWEGFTIYPQYNGVGIGSYNQNTIENNKINNLVIGIAGSGITINKKIKLQVERGSTVTAFEPHQGKELPLDLPVENLINPQNLELYGNYRYVKSADDYYINVNANTAYIFSIKEFTGDGRLYEYDKDNNLLKENQLYSALTNGYITIITTENTKKIRFYAAMYSSTPTEIPTVYTPQCMLFKGSLPSPYTPYGTEPIELCKIGNYQDYFYKSGSKWYLHKEIVKKVIDGTESWNYYSTGRYFYNSTILNDLPRSASSKVAISFASNRFVYTGAVGSPSDNQMILVQQPDRNNEVDIRYDSIGGVVADFKNWLSANNISVYHSLVTPTDTEITNTTLISQLEAIYNAPLYEETNITQENNDLPMVLDITACKDNINGIKAFIRK